MSKLQRVSISNSQSSSLQLQNYFFKLFYQTIPSNYSYLTIPPPNSHQRNELSLGQIIFSLAWIFSSFVFSSLCLFQYGSLLSIPPLVLLFQLLSWVLLSNASLSTASLYSALLLMANIDRFTFARWKKLSSCFVCLLNRSTGLHLFPLNISFVEN